MPSMRLLRWFFAAAAVVCAGLFGHFIGAKRERDKVADELAAYQTELNSGGGQFAAEIAELKSQRDIADATNRSLQESLKQMEAQSLDKESAERLYERIEGVDVNTGLGVDTVSKVNDAEGNLSELHITVVQARGRDRVKGRIGLSLLGEHQGSNWREVIFDAEDDEAPRFDMRFFQTLVVPVTVEDILIDIVEIDIVPSGKRHKPFRYEQDWSSILEE